MRGGFVSGAGTVGLGWVTPEPSGVVAAGASRVGPCGWVPCPYGDFGSARHEDAGRPAAPVTAP
ncbi:hypothetical protein GCM10010349_49150 [Streptomyces flavofungini]|nr:hypothetical protein GCM10010349_49150 [Streptomyces flavofungini]